MVPCQKLFALEGCLSVQDDLECVGARLQFNPDHLAALKLIKHVYSLTRRVRVALQEQAYNVALERI